MRCSPISIATPSSPASGSCARPSNRADRSTRRCWWTRRSRCCSSWIERCQGEQLLTPRVAYGYFPCGRDGNALVVFDPVNTTQVAELGRFELPRQRGGNRYCISDFYRDLLPSPDGRAMPT
jgi:cobalamin-dependent methionine synthase I